MNKAITLFSLLIFNFSLCFAQWVTNGTQISFSPQNHHRAFVSAADSGRFYVTWVETDTTSKQYSSVLLAKYDGGGNLCTGWTSGGVMVSNKGDHYAPQLITSEDKTVIVTWYGWDSTSNYSQVYIQKYSAKGVAMWNSGKPVQVTPGKGFDCQYPMLVSDKHNGTFLTWMRYDTNLSASSPDIFLQHIDSSGHVATGWSATPATVAAIPSLREYYPHLALTPDQKTVYVVYGAGLVGSTAIVLKRFHAANGNPVIGGYWHVNGDTISAGGNAYPDINHDFWLYADNNNNALITWIEARFTGNGEVYMQQVDTTGKALLAPTGSLMAGVTSTFNGIDYLQEVQESDGDLLLTFNNLDKFNDVEAMKIQPDGNILWLDTNITKNGNSAYPIPVSDGNKGMCAFYVFTGPSEILHAIALDSAGNLYKTWTLPGPNFGLLHNYDSFEPNYDVNPAATNAGEAVVAWNRRTSLYNMFICDLLSDGSTCTTPADVSGLKINNEQVIVYPNPSTGKFTIEVKSEELRVKNIIEIYNVLGEKVYSNSLSIKDSNPTFQLGQALSINLSNNASGIYFYRLINQTGNLVSSGKLILSK